MRFWGIYPEMVRIPEGERAARLATVAVDPLAARLLDAAARFTNEGLDYFGAPVLNPFWAEPVDGQGFAILRDCQDQRNYGSLYSNSGEKRTAGTDRYNVRAEFSRGNDGQWRVRELIHEEDVPC